MVHRRGQARDPACPMTRQGTEMAEDKDEAEPADRAEERVGYGRPPRRSRFRPGRSGNPMGRPKGAEGYKTILERVVLAEHMVIEQGKRQRRTVLELILLALR